MTHSIAHPTSLFSFLSRLNKKPAKALSQNFLIDQNVIQKFCDFADIKPGDVVLEIGPGAGALTEEIIRRKACVIAIEKDSTLAAELQSRFKDAQIISSDFLDANLNQILPKKALEEGKKIKVISNLPFQLTSPILAKLCPLNSFFSTLTLIMQKEVAERLTASPNSKTYSSLSVFANFYSSPRPLFDIASNCYFPKPNVTTTAIQLTLNKPSLNHESEFISFVREAFNQRRKMISSSLSLPATQVQTALEEIGLNPKSRPENLSLRNWIDLFLKLF